ncbi:MAG: glycyl-radical enzyme activating protein [Halanaerobiaceae bacterium]
MKNKDNRGIIFDIKRFSLHDGPGIRTTVFLKGCNLRCSWCHNPESWSHDPQLSYNEDICVNCMKCVAACPRDVHENENGNHIVNYERCNLNNACIEACMSDALEIIGEEMTAAQIMKVVQKDYEYYSNSGGGLTISGGEPMLQFEFVRELLKLAKEKDIHICMDTSGYASKVEFKKIMKYVDLFLFDYKATDKKRHKEFTGVSNDKILGNLDFLYNQGSNIILRCPLIQGVNDVEKHLQGIAGICKSYPEIKKVEIMAYHNMGNSKAQNVGKKINYSNLENAREETKTKWINKIKELGCDKVEIG